MDVFLDFPLLSVFITVVALFVFVKVLTALFRSPSRVERQCANCGMVLPGNANFCGRCGSKVDDPRIAAGPR
jgi:rRNA maturation endonuclease Nob1